MTGSFYSHLAMKNLTQTTSEIMELMVAYLGIACFVGHALTLI